MKVNIYIPDSLADITLDQYQRFEKLNTEDNQNSNFLLHKMVEIFCKIDLKNIAKIKFSYVSQIAQDLNKVFNQKSDLITTFKMRGIEYGMIPKLDDITLGEYIDLDESISDWDTMHKAMSVLYRPITIRKDDRYQIEEYTEETDPGKFKNMPLNVVMGALVFFWSLSDELLQTTLKYLAKEMKDNLTFQQRQILEESGVGINQSMAWLKGMLPGLIQLPD
jgi:hypothetical protein|tara:strand:- start:4289 stop:4951 length:663 start_codon:yes stop_codon:yes gene_type:complete